MIELPARPALRTITPRLIDFGKILRPALGAETTRLDRMGNRFAAELAWPPMERETADVFISRLLAAKEEGLRVTWPLSASQGSPGTSASPGGGPVIDGAGQTGKTLVLRGLTPNYAFRERFWLTLIDDVAAAPALGDGARYLHVCRSNVAANAAGQATIAITPGLRAPFGDGATVLLARPTIEGWISGDEWSWAVPVERLVALTVPLEECG